MKIYINTMLHSHWNGEECWLKLYTTFPMNEDEFVEYFNKHIAGKDITTYRDMGIETNIWFIDTKPEWIYPKKIAKIKQDKKGNKDKYYCNLYFADEEDPIYYNFYSECVSLVDIDTKNE